MRMTLLQPLPLEVGAHTSLHFEEYSTFDKLKKYVLKYIKTIKGLKRAQGEKPARLVELDGSSVGTGGDDDDDHDPQLDNPEYVFLLQQLGGAGCGVQDGGLCRNGKEGLPAADARTRRTTPRSAQAGPERRQVWCSSGDAAEDWRQCPLQQLWP